MTAKKEKPGEVDNQTRHTTKKHSLLESHTTLSLSEKSFDIFNAIPIKSEKDDTIKTKFKPSPSQKLFFEGGL